MRFPVVHSAAYSVVLLLMVSFLMLLAGCGGTVVPDAGLSSPSADPLAPAGDAPQAGSAPGSPAPYASDAWAVRHLSPSLESEAWLVVEEKLWYISGSGIHYLDLLTGEQKEIHGQAKHNTMFLAGGSIWFTNNYLWAYGDYPQGQIPLARYDLASAQYEEYPPDQIPGVNAFVLASLDQIWVCASDRLYRYDQAANAFFAESAYGESVRLIAGNEDILAVYTVDSSAGAPLSALSVYDRQGLSLAFDSPDFPPHGAVYRMSFLEDELFFCWGDLGEPSGVSYMNIRSAEWAHYIDHYDEEDFSTALEYTRLYGYPGEILIRHDAVYIMLRVSDVYNLFRFSFANRLFSLVFATSDYNVFDVSPSPRGDLIALPGGLLDYAWHNAPDMLFDGIEVSRIICVDDGTYVVNTAEGLFLCAMR